MSSQNPDIPSAVSSVAPHPPNEMERVLKLLDYKIDFSNPMVGLADLTRLAAQVSGTEISVINLIDHFMQWSVSSFGIDLHGTPREETVCQYTILEENALEIRDLRMDERFNQKDFVTQGARLRYYLGVPLKARSGEAIGSLCVLDHETKSLSPEKIEMLSIIASEIVHRLELMRVIESLQERIRTVSHDIRGPLGGITGLSSIMREQMKEGDLTDMEEMLTLIENGSRSVLELADEILSSSKNRVGKSEELAVDEWTVGILRDKIKSLYEAQARPKNICYEVTDDSEGDAICFSRRKILQIVGNLVSNAIKFTPEGGAVSVSLASRKDEEKCHLAIRVSDNGVGMTAEQIQALTSDSASSRTGTKGETGYGFGIQLVRHLMEEMGGTMAIESEVGKGTAFRLSLPITDPQ